MFNFNRKDYEEPVEPVRPKYKAPAFNIRLFKGTFEALEVPINDRFRIKPVPASVV